MSPVIHMGSMAEVSIGDLRKHGGDIVERLARGDRVTITRAGKPVAELWPLRRDPVPLEVVIENWRHLPRIDPNRLRADLDGLSVVAVPPPDG